jgi:hypothetical protein
MKLSRNEALANLRALKGSLVVVSLRFTPGEDTPLGVLRITSLATVHECDDKALQLTWPPNGHLYVSFEDASFKSPDRDETSLWGWEIVLPNGIRCVVCPQDRSIN